MKATLTFNLPEEKEEHEMAVHALDMYCVIIELREKLVRIFNGKEPEMSDEELLRELNTSIEDRGLESLLQ